VHRSNLASFLNFTTIWKRKHKRELPIKWKEKTDRDLQPTMCSFFHARGVWAPGIWELGGRPANIFPKTGKTVRGLAMSSHAAPAASPRGVHEPRCSGRNCRGGAHLYQPGHEASTRCRAWIPLARRLPPPGPAPATPPSARHCNRSVWLDPLTCAASLRRGAFLWCLRQPLVVPALLVLP
jgi:hypothetical protein